MKRSWTWIVGVGIAWALLAPALPSLIETVRYSLAITDFVSMSDHLETVVDVIFGRWVAIPIIAAVLCFVLVVFAKAPLYGVRSGEPSSFLMKLPARSFGARALSHMSVEGSAASGVMLVAQSYAVLPGNAVWSGVG